VRTGFARVDERFQRVDDRFQRVDDQLHRMDVRISETQLDLNRMQARMTRMELVFRTRMDDLELAYLEVREIDARVARCEADLAELKASRPTPG
jgi:chromosome segregation ATPase